MLSVIDLQVLAEKVRARRVELNWSLRQLGERAKVSHGYIDKLEKGAMVRPGWDKLSRVTEALGLPLEEITGVTDEDSRKLIPEVDQFTRSISMLPFDAQREVIEQASIFFRMKFFEWQEGLDSGSPKVLGKPPEEKL